MDSLPSQRRLRWLGHVHHRNDGRIPKGVLYIQLTTGVRKVRRPALQFMDACKCNLKACKIDPNNWEDPAIISDRARWRWTLKEGIKKVDMKCNVTRKLKKSTQLYFSA